MVQRVTSGAAQTNQPQNVYDISGWQGELTNQQGAELHNHVPFMIVKADQGGYEDYAYPNNSQVLRNNHIPYGAYDYSVYSNPTQAVNEATALRNQAPHAKFYVNDSEVNNAGSLLDSSTQAWANTIHRLTRKPAVLYSDLSFMNNFQPQTRNAYNALWVAAYGEEPDPAYHYDLWQYTDQHYSPALNQDVDASTFPDGSNKPLSFWTGKYHSRKRTPIIIPYIRYRHIRRKSSKAIHKVKKVNHKRRFRRKRTAYIKPIYRTRKPRKVRRHYSYQYKLDKHLDYLSGHFHHHTTHYIRPHYYHTLGKDSWLKVTSPHGIWLYHTNGKRWAHVPRNMVLGVNKYQLIYYHRTFIYQAVGTHWGLPDIFTSNEKSVSNNC